MATPFGLLAWLGWFFLPRFVIAFYSLKYFDQNPFLVVVAWIWAIIGTFGEEKAVEKVVDNRTIVNK